MARQPSTLFYKNNVYIFSIFGKFNWIHNPNNTLHIFKMKNNYYIHPKALCETKNIGENTRIWAFTHLLPGSKIGANCNICDFVFIEDGVVIGNNVTVKSGVHLWSGLQVEDDVFIGPNATFTNDIFPRSKVYHEKPMATLIKKGASIGANATILPGITIGENAMIGAGTVVVSDVPKGCTVVGNPGKIIKQQKEKLD